MVQSRNLLVYVLLLGYILWNCCRILWWWREFPFMAFFRWRENLLKWQASFLTLGFGFNSIYDWPFKVRCKCIKQNRKRILYCSKFWAFAFQLKHVFDGRPLFEILCVCTLSFTFYKNIELHHPDWCTNISMFSLGALCVLFSILCARTSKNKYFALPMQPELHSNHVL